MRSLATALFLSCAVAAAQEEENEYLRPAETVTVEASRLAGQTLAADRIPQAVIVIDREQIERSAATNVADLLSELTPAIAYDQVGNGREAVVDLRGFNEGAAAAVFVDDVRVNEPDDNRVLLAQIPLDRVARIEVVKGSSSGLLGGGALSGAIRIYTTDPSRQSSARLSAGSFGSGSAAVQVQHAGAGEALEIGAGYFGSDGFRQNGEAREGWLSTAVGLDGEHRQMRLSYTFSRTRFGSPGALTAAELEADRRQAPYNLVDENRDGTHLLSADLRQDLGTTVVRGNFYFRSNEAEGLTTGRYAALFGGFASQSSNAAGGATLQVERSLGGSSTLSAGTELSWVNLEAEGWYTDLSGARTAQASWTDTDEGWQALFAQVETAPWESLTLLLGARYDHQALHYHDRLAGSPTVDRSFSRWTYRSGMSLEWARGMVAFAEYSTAFQTPTIVDLFAFPLFGSNPDLRPSRAGNLEIGQRIAAGPFSAQLSLYDLSVRDEVIFVLTDPIHFIGRNENAGRSRRRGFDLDAAATLPKGWRIDAAYSYLRARFESGTFEGNELVMVPRHKLTAGLSKEIAPGLRVGGRVRSVGAQYVQNDESNLVEKLPAYTTVDVKARYGRGRWSIEGSLRNLTNRKYSTRAITDGFTTYFTPAPGINGQVSLGCDF